MARYDSYSTVNRLRLRTMLKERGLDRPLDDHELALQLLDTELRLERTQETLDAIIDALQGHSIYLDDPA